MVPAHHPLTFGYYILAQPTMEPYYVVEIIRGMPCSLIISTDGRSMHNDIAKQAPGAADPDMLQKSRMTIRSMHNDISEEAPGAICTSNASGYRVGSAV